MHSGGSGAGGSTAPPFTPRPRANADLCTRARVACACLVPRLVLHRCALLLLTHRRCLSVYASSAPLA
jgi:hypothetical protein